MDHDGITYRTRMLSCIAASLLTVVAAVHLWPRTGPNSDLDGGYFGDPGERIQLEEIVPTRHAAAAPAPPAPPIPIIVPDSYVLEEPDLEFADDPLSLDEAGPDPVSGSEGQEAARAAGGPTIGPKTVRFVEPEYTREARRRRIRAELVVRVLVDERGRVAEATIVERFLLDGDGISRTPVGALGYGLEEAALSAADRWMFRPARRNGEPVSSQTELTFTFGVDA
jgi:protein TonB